MYKKKMAYQPKYQMQILYSTREVESDQTMDDLIMDAFASGAEMLHVQSTPENVQVTTFKDREPSTQIIAKEPAQSGSGPSAWIIVAGIAVIVTAAWLVLK